MHVVVDLTAVRAPPSDADAAPLLPDLLARLSRVESVRAARHSRPLDAWRAAAGRLLVEAVAAPHVAAREAGGRLRIVAAPVADDARRQMPPPHDVSLSHHGGWVVAATAVGCHVGVDVLRVPDAPLLRTGGGSAPAALRRFFGDGEWAAIRDDRNDDAVARVTFCAAWTAKEAYVKVRGCRV